MIEAEKINILTLSFQDKDIDNFVSIIEKLLIASNQVVFKKPFTIEERNTIYDIAKSVGIELPENINIYAFKDLIKEI